MDSKGVNMSKDCKNCRYGDTEYDEYCGAYKCQGFSLWQKVFKPSDMDLLALESLRDSREVYGENGIEGVVESIGKTFYQVDHALASMLYAEKPCTDLTKEEVKEHLFENVWMWNDECDLDKYELTGFNRVGKNYIGIHHIFAHASLTKPKF